MVTARLFEAYPTGRLSRIAERRFRASRTGVCRDIWSNDIMREAEVLLSETHMSCDAVVEGHWRGGPGCGQG